MAHEKSAQYGKILDAKLRTELVCADGVVFNAAYEGEATAGGSVKIPVRDAEVSGGAYNRETGKALSSSSTTYKTLNLNMDEAVNELIDSHDAQSVPDGIVLDRLDSAGDYLARKTELLGINSMESVADANNTKIAALANVYKELLVARTKLSRAGVPIKGRFALVSPEAYAELLVDPNFIKQSDLSQEMVAAGVMGQAAGFNIIECCNLKLEDTTITVGKKTTTNFIAGHPQWNHRVRAMVVNPYVADLTNSENFVGACAVKGRLVGGALVSKPNTLYFHRTQV